jgi:hypothetical protein
LNKIEEEKDDIKEAFGRENTLRLKNTGGPRINETCRPTRNGTMV